MSQSMLRDLPLNGFGTCVTYGEGTSMGIGLPIEIDENRPVVIAHPAAGNHYHASMSLFEDAEHPFVHVLVDYGQFCPDEWPYHADSAHHAIYQRLHDTSEHAPVFRKTSIAVPHWQIHIVNEAYEYLSKAPPVDILYVDWMTWLDQFVIDSDTAFPEMMAHYASNIRDGGLVILDHKHIMMGEDGNRWFNHPGGVFAVGQQSQMEEMCTIEWLGMNANYEMQTFEATVFKVHHLTDGPLGHLDWNEAIMPWFGNSIPEMALNQQQVQSLIEADHSESVHPNAITWDNWHDTWSSIYMEASDQTMTFQTPVPPRVAWPKAAYMGFLQWLVHHPQCLQVTPEKQSYTLQGENFTLNLIHGDLLELAPTLYNKHAALAVRDTLQQQVIRRCPWWKHQVTTLQTSESWLPNPISGLRWSGESATPNLAKLLMRQAKAQSKGRPGNDWKQFQCTEVVTVAHGTATLSEVMAAVEAYYQHLRRETPRSASPLKLTVVYLDESEYQEVEMPPNWRRQD